MSDHLAPVIDGTSVIAGKPSVASETGELVERPVAVPEHGMGLQQVESAVRIKWRATARGTYGLPLVIDAECSPVVVPRGHSELLHLASAPEYRHKAIH